jgi:hypothetical protein
VEWALVKEVGASRSYPVLPQTVALFLWDSLSLTDPAARAPLNPPAGAPSLGVPSRVRRAPPKKSPQYPWSAPQLRKLDAPVDPQGKPWSG